MRLKDVGRAELGAEDYSSDLQFNGHDAVGIGVTQLSTANALEVDRAGAWPSWSGCPSVSRPA